MNRPSTYELECFVAVADELNFSRAARKMHLSQPPLTRQIQALEAKVGCTLLLRNTRMVSLTPSGRLFLEDARAVLNQLDAAADAVRRAEGGETRRLRISFIGALLDEKMLAILQQFRRSHPHCQIHLTDLSPSDQWEGVIAGTIDVAFLGAPPQTVPRRLRSVVWKREPLCLAMPAGHRLARSRSVHLRDFREEGWIMVSQASAPPFRQFFDRLCRAENFRPRVVQESDRVAAVLTMVAASQGVSLLPKTLAKLAGDGVVFRQFPGRNRPTLEHTCVFPAKPASPELADFIKALPALKDSVRGTPDHGLGD